MSCLECLGEPAFNSWSLDSPSCLGVSFVCRQAAGTKRLNFFWRGVYSNDVLVESSLGASLASALYDFVKAYLWQAHAAYVRGLSHFALFPKLHAIHEVAHEMRRQSKASAWIVNPAAHTCSLDEDFIGRTAAVSRCVSPRAIPLRLLQRYLTHIQIAWSRGYQGEER